MKVLEVGQQNGMSPNALYRDILDTYLQSERYKQLQIKGFLNTNLHEIDHILDYLKDK
jgi:ABC-type lipoprotein release transport system permease subunit